MSHTENPYPLLDMTPESLRWIGLTTAAEYPASTAAQDLLSQIWDAVNRPPGEGRMVAGLYAPMDLADALALAVLIAIEHSNSKHPGSHWARCDSARELVLKAAESVTNAVFIERES